MKSIDLPLSRWPRHLSGWLETSWARGWTDRPSLEGDAIVAAAIRRSGFRPFDGPWRSRLDLLCHHLNDEARLNAFGRTLAHGQLVKIVAARARADRLHQNHPEISRRPLRAPVVIVGQMRSGTTRMHRLLACDPAFAGNHLYEQLDPVPRAGWPRFVDPRRASAAFLQRGLAFVEPALQAIHPTRAGAVEEDFGLHAFSIWGAVFEGQWHLPGFARAMESSESSDVYVEFRRLLRLLAWVRGDAPERTPLLKAPQFAQDLDALIARFPDARLAVLDRASEEVVASSASLAWHYVRLQSDEISAAAVGAEWLRKTRLRARRLAASLDRHPHIARVMIDYDEMSRDWRGAVRRVYAMTGMTLDPAVERRMERMISQGHKRAQHHYSLEQFGLDGRQVAAALS
jgi:hypothetical protein